MDEAALHELLSGRRRDVVARLLRSGLSVASVLYAGATNARNWAFNQRLLPIHRAPVPVISVGNMTTGGTGKTPVVAWLVHRLLGVGCRPGILSRGYHSLTVDSSGQPISSENDEKRVLDRLCPGVPHLQQRDRVNSATLASQELGCNVLVLDDGFQHRRLHRDLDLVLIDSLRPWGYGYRLPRGLLRESLRSLRRADTILITRANQSSSAERDQIRAQLHRYRGTDECVEVEFTPQWLIDLHGTRHSIGSLAGKSVFAFCGIGNSIGFFQTVETLNVACRQSQAFPDHYHYTSADQTALANRAKSLGVDAVLVTQKDIVKLSATDWHGPPLFAIEIGAELMSGAEILEAHLSRIVRTARA